MNDPKSWRRATSSALVLAAILTVAPCRASTRAACPGDVALEAADLVGRWNLRFAEEAEPQALLELRPSKEFSDGLEGVLVRESERRQVAGDIENGLLTLEESADGVHIHATWTARAVEGQCGALFSGRWTDSYTGRERDFILRRPSASPSAR